MANVIQGLLNSAPKAQSAAPFMQLASESFNRGIEGATKIAKGIEQRSRNAAVNQILSMDPLDDPGAYQAALTDRLSNVSGIDPVMALNLASAKSKPAFEERKRQDSLSQIGIENAYRDANLIQKQDEAEDNQTYRNNITTETKRHNVQMERPTDIREAYQAGYATGVKVDPETGNESKYLTKEDFAKYQMDKAKASFSQRVLDPSTIDKNKSATIKNFDDILFKQLGEDGYAEYNKLPAQQRTELLQYWLDNGVIDYSMTEENTFSSDNYGQGSASKGYQRQTVEPTVVQQSGSASDNNTYDTQTARVPAGTKVGQKIGNFTVVSINADGTAEVR